MYIVLISKNKQIRKEFQAEICALQLYENNNNENIIIQFSVNLFMYYINKCLSTCLWDETLKGLVEHNKNLCITTL